MRFEVFMVVRMMMFFWVVLALCRLVYMAPKPRRTSSKQKLFITSSATGRQALH
jgi:hypothetical protein